MRIPTLGLLLSTLAACHPASPPRDVSGPFTGAVHRYRVDAMALPTARDQFSDDLDGDGRVDNELSFLVGAALTEGVTSKHAGDMIASGMAGGVVELQSDDPALRDDETVGVRFRGGNRDDGLMGAVLREGVVTTNRLRLTHTPVAATLRVPLLDADPLLFPLLAAQAQLSPDGHGGWDMDLQGVTADAHGEVTASLAPALLQGWGLRPSAYGSLLALFDRDRDGHITADEITGSPLLLNVVSPDLDLFDAGGRWAPRPDAVQSESYSVAVHLHLSPCSDEACSAPAAAPSCFDRVRDGDEVGVDCGGSCGACPAGTGCSADKDCQSRCVDQVCAEPTCSDGVNDGVEGGVDCGWGCATPCPDGAGCVDGAGCASGSCVVGMCAPTQAQ
jgi:hypothetical protein